MDKLLKTLVIATLAPIALAACENPPQKSRLTLSPGFGDAVRHNMAVQIVNPDGSQDFNPPPMDGARADDAVERYRAGHTVKVIEQKTSSVGGGK
jgi:type IV pilus biogenesis protein CpaD/CtpE